MSLLEIISAPPAAEMVPPVSRLPRWLRRPLPSQDFGFTDQLLGDLGLETVCREAKCPNRTECWSRKTATFMVLGRICTRPCGFCAVERGKPAAVATDEPERLAEAAERLGLAHVVITSVTRDDLPDQGADHFRRCVDAVRRRTGARVEVLTPDFDARPELLDILVQSKPDVFNHNIETVARLQQRVRRKAAYETSLATLRYIHNADPSIVTKSGIMLGLGETTAELLDTFADLRSVGVKLLTVGQYLQPSPGHLPVERFVPPEEFAEIGRLAQTMGFAHVASAPFVRSSYHADEAWQLGVTGDAS